MNGEVSPFGRPVRSLLPRRWLLMQAIFEEEDGYVERKRESAQLEPNGIWP